MNTSWFTQSAKWLVIAQFYRLYHKIYGKSPQAKKLFQATERSLSDLNDFKQTHIHLSLQSYKNMSRLGSSALVRQLV